MGNADTPASGRFSWLGPISSLLAILACYGTLAAVALLSVLGISVELNEGLLVKIIIGLMILAIAGMAYSYRTHRNVAPLTLSVAAAAAVIWAFSGTYSQTIEIIGFAGLIVASVWDFRARKRACSG